MSRGMLNRKIEGHMKANPSKPPWGLFEGGGEIEKYFILTWCKKFDLTPHPHGVLFEGVGGGGGLFHGGG